MSAILVDNIDFSYPDGTQALRGLSLDVAPRERVAILGPNGAGKTTLALHLNGLERATNGKVFIFGQEIADSTVGEIRRRVQLVFADSNDQLFMPTVREDVAFGPANLGLSDGDLEARVAEALEAVGAAELAGRAPHHLSTGERRRAALATALAMRPDVLVLDEPTGGLDPVGRRDLRNVLQSLPHTLIAITHDLPFALELCPRSVIVAGGRVVADGATRDLLADPALLAANDLELPYGFDPLATG